MQYEKSCGAVVFTRQGSDLCYVIIRSVNGHCGFPKGHVEPGETERQTALREILEEVGLRAKLIDGFRMVEEYPHPQKTDVTRQVVYFLAEYAGQALQRRPEELSEVHLLSFEEAFDLLTYQTAKDILVEANRVLLG